MLHLASYYYQAHIKCLIAITNVDYIPVILYYIFVPIASYIEHASRCVAILYS